MRSFSSVAHALLQASLLLSGSTYAQTWTSCNPLTTTCPAETALGKSISIDFTKGAVNSFTASGTPTYNSNGVSFTVAKSGDAPQLDSLFYIMFGKVSVTMKAAPGAGIVSSVVLQSSDLDEIDFEWLGADDSQVQTNYFGKGDTTTYNRGTYAAAAGNQANFITYTIEWTSTQIVWSVGGSVVRVLTPATAATNQYPQTPMQVKLGSWSGGDASNAAGTISWARGPTDYTKGPFSMLVQSMSIEDYSTGTSYTYGDKTGAWTSIKSNGGVISGNAPSGGSVAIVNPPSATSASPSIPAGIGSSTKTGWPWVATTLSTSVAATSSIAGIPSGWTVSGNGKIVPASTAATTTSPTSYYSPVQSSSSSSALSSNGAEVVATVTSSYAPTRSSSSVASVSSSVIRLASTAAAVQYKASSNTTLIPSVVSGSPTLSRPTTSAVYTGAGSLAKPASSLAAAIVAFYVGTIAYLA